MAGRRENKQKMRPRISSKFYYTNGLNYSIIFEQRQTKPKDIHGLNKEAHLNPQIFAKNATAILPVFDQKMNSKSSIFWRKQISEYRNLGGEGRHREILSSSPKKWHCE